MNVIFTWTGIDFYINNTADWVQFLRLMVFGSLIVLVFAVVLSMFVLAFYISKDDPAKFFAEIGGVSL